MKYPGNCLGRVSGSQCKISKLHLG